MKTIIYFIISFYFFSYSLTAQLWNPNVDNENYKNPIIYADYSDPDVISTEDGFYMVASSFTCMPGIPVLYSKDLVNWTIVNHVYDSLPLQKFDIPQHGRGAWAPSIRYHNGNYFVYFCTPDDGLFMASAQNPLDKWNLFHIEKVAEWEDPCPLWDDDGNTYLVRSKVCGNELYLHKMSADGKKLLDNGTLIYKDTLNPTIEGPKFMKKDGYYYILAPAGGVPTGWQTVLRSKNIYGPWEAKKVLHQANTTINGPHQGALIQTSTGKWWFIHFQSLYHYGRIVHLQPAGWKDNWPVMGTDINNDNVGEPVYTYKKPFTGNAGKQSVPQTSDEFNNSKLGLQWQWQANPKQYWYSLDTAPGNIRLFAVKNPTQNGNFWFVPNLLLQKFAAPGFTATTLAKFNPGLNGEKAGLVIMGTEWAYISLVKEDNKIMVATFEGKFHQCEDLTIKTASREIMSNECYMRVRVDEAGNCIFSYSLNGSDYFVLGNPFPAKPGRWIGSKVGIFCINPNIPESKGYADFDWFRME